MLLLTLYVGSTRGAVLLSDNFDSENGGAGALNYGGFANWNATTVDLIGNGSFDFYPGNGLYVDMEHFSNGTLTSKAIFGVGSYTLSFLLGNNSFSGNSVKVTLADFSQLFPSSQGMPFTLQNVAFSTSILGPLQFISEGPNDAGGSIVDVIVLESSSVPEPTTLALVGAACVGLCMRRRFRR